MYDILKDKYRRYLLEKMNIECTTLYNIIKHITKYNYINDSINNPFTIYHRTINNISNNKFAIKILNIHSCNIYKLKYKVHSLLSEGKQLKNVNTEIADYIKNHYLLRNRYKFTKDIKEVITYKNNVTSEKKK